MVWNNKIFLLWELTSICYGNYVSKLSFVLTTNMAAMQSTYSRSSPLSQRVDFNIVSVLNRSSRINNVWEKECGIGGLDGPREQVWQIFLCRYYMTRVQTFYFIFVFSRAVLKSNTRNFEPGLYLDIKLLLVYCCCNYSPSFLLWFIFKILPEMFVFCTEIMMNYSI